MSEHSKKIICFHCTDLVDVLNRLEISLDDFDNAPLKMVGYKDLGDIICSNCDNELDVGDLYFECEEDHEQFLDEAIQIISETLSAQISQCFRCPAGQDIESFLYTVNKELKEDGITYSNPGTEIYEFLFDEEVPEQYHEKVKNYLICSNCGYGKPHHPKHNPNSYHFELHNHIYHSREVIDRFWGYDDEDFIELATNFGIDLEIKELEGFREFIYKYPMLALTKDTAKKIYSLLEKIYKDNEFIILNTSQILYRGRPRKKDDKVLTPEQLWSPPEGLPTHGRYNSVGVSVLYCCDKVDGIPYELHPTNEQDIDIAKFELINDLKLFDIDRVFKGFEGFFALPNEESKMVKKAYLFTNFVGSCCAEIGFNGVKYKGVGKGDYTNFALFNVQQDKDLVIKDVITKRVEITYS